MFKDLKIKNLKIIILLICYLIVFYFLIFKNILKLVEIKELTEQEDIKIGRLNYEKNTVLKALALKKENFEKEQQKIVKNEEYETKKSFDNIPSLFRYIEDKYLYILLGLSIITIILTIIIHYSLNSSEKKLETLELESTKLE